MLKCGIYFTCRFIGEESTSDDTHLELSDDPTWVIDPIDGTTNFVHRFVTDRRLTVLCRPVIYVVMSELRDLVGPVCVPCDVSKYNNRCCPLSSVQRHVPRKHRSYDRGSCRTWHKARHAMHLHQFLGHVQF